MVISTKYELCVIFLFFNVYYLIASNLKFFFSNMHNAIIITFSCIKIDFSNSDKYAALWPFLGICAEVAVLCTIIFIYEKRRQKPDFDESETDHNTEK